MTLPLPEEEPTTLQRIAWICSNLLMTLSIVGRSLWSRIRMNFKKSLMYWLLSIISSFSWGMRSSVCLMILTKKWAQSGWYNRNSPVKSSKKTHPIDQISLSLFVPTCFLRSYLSWSFLVWIYNWSISGDLIESVPLFLTQNSSLSFEKILHSPKSPIVISKSSSVMFLRSLSVALPSLSVAPMLDFIWSSSTKLMRILSHFKS